MKSSAKSKRIQESGLTLTNGIIALITVLICTILFSYQINLQKKELLHFNVTVGNIWTRETLKADFNFPVFKDNYVYAKEKSDAKKNAIPVYTYNDLAKKQSKLILENVFSYLKTGDRTYFEIIKEAFDDDPIKYFTGDKKEDAAKKISRLEKLLNNFSFRIYRNEICDNEINRSRYDEILVKVDFNTNKIYKSSEIIDSKTYNDLVKELISTRTDKNEISFIKSVCSKIFQPTLVFSQDLSENEIKLAELSVPKTNGIVRTDEIIVEKGQRITDEIMQKLFSYQHSKYLKNEEGNLALHVLGSAGHALFIYFIFFIFLLILRKRIISSTTNFAILNILLLIVSALAWISVQIPSKYPFEYLIIVPSISMLVAILFDSRTAFYFTVTISLLVAGIRGNDYDTGTALLFAGVLGAYTVRDIQSRTQMFKSIFIIAIGFIFPIISISLERSISIDQGIIKASVALVNSMISPIITFGLLFIIERFTNITSDLKLEEYNKLSNPLLVKMNETAPGTYQHTLQLAILSEKCAEAIDANKLLARVGALYHDIGKVARPEYFIENQTDPDSKHNLLAPKKSAEAIRSHVLEGMRIAREYKLPEKIVDFIPMHHGTFLIKHFYAKALEEFAPETVNENDYRYPGPKPNNKETAIVMICDSVEAISRLTGNDREVLEKAIDKTIESRLNDGQFDDCNITIKDLHIIKETCLKNLTGVAHQRVEYKEIPEKKNI